MRGRDDTGVILTGAAVGVLIAVLLRAGGFLSAPPLGFEGEILSLTVVAATFTYGAVRWATAWRSHAREIERAARQAAMDERPF